MWKCVTEKCKTTREVRSNLVILWQRFNYWNACMLHLMTLFSITWTRQRSTWTMKCKEMAVTYFTALLKLPARSFKVRTSLFDADFNLRYAVSTGKDWPTFPPNHLQYLLFILTDIKWRRFRLSLPNSVFHSLAWRRGRFFQKTFYV